MAFAEKGKPLRCNEIPFHQVHSRLGQVRGSASLS